MSTMGLIGHGALVGRFVSACRENRLPHAWLLYGMKGIGKATAAKVMAQAALCECMQDDGACGTCHGCRMVQGESHPDLLYVGLEWDEKKKRWARDIRVEQVRQLLEFLAMTGLQGHRRVVILDDADVLNSAAANALLKGLEEPVGDALLLMVCHDLSALPETIRSRCVLEHISPLHDQEVQQVLTALDVPESVHAFAVRLAQGCPGRVVALQDEQLAQACEQWQALTHDLATADIAAVDAWLHQHVQQVPHDLIADMALQGVWQVMMQGELPFAHSEALYQAAKDVLAWQQEVRAHTLKPATALLTRLLVVRRLLQSMRL